MTVWAMSIHPANSTLAVACSRPWMIFPKGGAWPQTVHKARASNANKSLSCLVIFSLGTHRIGIYGLWFVVPGEASRSTAWRCDLSPVHAPDSPSQGDTDCFR